MLAAPVAVRGAWPLHRAAVKNPLHGTATMDTLVSMGVSAAFLWSLYVLSSSPGPSARWVRHCGCCSISVRTPGWWAFGCDAVALPVVSAGLLDPMITGVTMALSSFLVVTNSLRLRRFTAADH